MEIVVQGGIPAVAIRLFRCVVPVGLVAAYRYAGDSRYLGKARENVYLMVQTEETFGHKGYYISRAADVIQATQPWAWCYSQLGVIEYWRETSDRRVADYLVRIADWLINKRNPPIKPASETADGGYLPNGISYSWTPDKVAEDRSLALAGLALPVLTTAARIANRDDLRERAQQIFRDYAFYRDFNEGKSVPPAMRHVINFRSLLYPASATKVYGQMGLTVSEYLPEIAGSIASPGQPFPAQPLATQPGPSHPIPSTPAPVSQPNAPAKTASLDLLQAQTLIVGQSLSFTLSQTDERGEPVQLYALNLPGGAAFDPNTGNFRFTPNPAQAGNVYQITLRAMNKQTDKTARLDVAVISAGAPDIAMIEPVASLPSDKPALISWRTTESARMKKYQIRLSGDGGASYPIVLAELPGDVNQFQWAIPKALLAAKHAKIRLMIKGLTESGLATVDFSKQDLRISK